MASSKDVTVGDERSPTPAGQVGLRGSQEQQGGPGELIDLRLLATDSSELKTKISSSVSAVSFMDITWAKFFFCPHRQSKNNIWSLFLLTFSPPFLYILYLNTFEPSLRVTQSSAWPYIVRLYSLGCIYMAKLVHSTIYNMILEMDGFPSVNWSALRPLDDNYGQILEKWLIYLLDWVHLYWIFIFTYKWCTVDMWRIFI